MSDQLTVASRSTQGLEELSPDSRLHTPVALCLRVPNLALAVPKRGKRIPWIVQCLSPTAAATLHSLNMQN